MVNDALDDGSDGHLVKIVSHEGMPSQFEQLGRAGFERRKKYVWSGGKRKAVWVWKDMVNGVEFVQLARPTLSLAKYLQMVGRGLRPCKGKQCCTMIDSVGLYRTFGLPSVDRDWGTFFY